MDYRYPLFWQGLESLFGSEQKTWNWRYEIGLPGATFTFMTEQRLKAKYQNVLTSIREVNGSLKKVHMEGPKLFVRAEVGADQLRNQVWNVIKSIDPAYSDLHADIIVNSKLPLPSFSGNCRVRR